MDQHWVIRGYVSDVTYRAARYARETLRSNEWRSQDAQDCKREMHIDRLI